MSHPDPTRSYQDDDQRYEALVAFAEKFVNTPFTVTSVSQLVGQVLEFKKIARKALKGE